MTLKMALEAYDEAFNDSFPTIPLLRGRTDAEAVEMIEKCLKENKDVYAMGYLDLEDVEY